MAIEKSRGLTPTERLLADLCDRTFLKLWSYPNPFKDDHDELCDVLAVFENHIFIFFDRESQVLKKKIEDVAVGWQRWKKKVTDDQIRTSHGAENYIRNGRKIYLDSDLSTQFPIKLDLYDIVIHKIIVAHGAAEARKQLGKDNLYGSLVIEYGNDDSAVGIPFLISIDRDNPVHIFDEHNLPIVLGELDNFLDFTAYFDAKVDAIKRTNLIYCGEEDLLAHYFTNYSESENRHYIGFPEKKADTVLIAEGEWKAFSVRDEYREKKRLDRVSYFWDEIIQRTCRNTLYGTLLGNSSPLRGKSAIHEMAKEPRFHRRSLSEAMIDAIRKFPDSSDSIVRSIRLMPSFYPEKRYLFFQLKANEIGDLP